MNLAPKVFQLVVLALSYCISASSVGDELADRAATTSEVAELVRTGEFSRLENMATTYRDSQARTSSGLWKLTLFYSGIRSYLDMRRQDEWLWETKY